jgi:replicative DNA helicase
MTGIILEHTKANDVYKMGDKISERLQQRAEHPNELPGLEVGWRQFDRVTKGAKPGDFIVVCAESKTGKSVTLLNWAKFISIDCGLPILWIDTEQDEEEQELRLLSILSQIPEDEIDMGLFMIDTAYGNAKDKIERLQKAQKIMKDSKFFFTYMPDFTLEKVTALTRKFQLKHGIVALFFDYLKLNSTMGTSKSDLRSDEKLTFFASGLKEMGGILKLPVLTANNENRANWGSTEKDARSVGGSLGILQLATKLCFLRNMTDEELALNGGRANQVLMIAYQRHGQSNVNVNVLFDKIRITQKEV